jgi:hypothetical protein
VPLILNSTPEGTGIGFLPIRDISYFFRNSRKSIRALMTFHLLEN